MSKKGIGISSMSAPTCTAIGAGWISWVQHFTLPPLLRTEGIRSSSPSDDEVGGSKARDARASAPLVTLEG
jgi:hypothetical protein